jgi:hypothetical protein
VRPVAGRCQALACVAEDRANGSDLVTCRKQGRLRRGGRRPSTGLGTTSPSRPAGPSWASPLATLRAGHLVSGPHSSTGRSCLARRLA